MKNRYFLFVALLVISTPLATAETEHTLFRHGSSIRTVAYSPTNSNRIASAGDSGEIKLRDLQDDTVTTLGRHADTVNAIAFSPDGGFLVSGSDAFDFKLWDLQTNRPILTGEHVADRTRSQVKAVAFSPDGNTFATAGLHVKLWNARTHREIATLRHETYIWTVGFSADGTLLATGDNAGHVTVWDLHTEQTLAQLQADSTAVYTVVFSPNTQILASAGYDGEVKMWNVTDWQPHGTLSTHGTTYALDFSPDGSLITGTGHESVDLWRADSGESLTRLTGHAEWVQAVTFSPDGSAIISGGSDGTLRLWNITDYRSIDPDRVRVVYFLPTDRSANPGIPETLDTLIRNVQSFYADEMERHGFGRKTFNFETDENGDLRVHRLDGAFRDAYYQTDAPDKIYEEVAAAFDVGKDVFFIVADLGNERIHNGGQDICGVGGGGWYIGENARRGRGGYAIVPASGDCFDAARGEGVTAHELGHAFGLAHDFRDDRYIMSYGNASDQLSQCAAGWLAASRFFNPDQTAFDQPTSIQMLTPETYLPNARNFTLQFHVTDADGLRHAQLLVPITAEDPTDALDFPKLHSCKTLNTQNSTLEFEAPALTQQETNTVTLQLIDAYGNITQQAYTLHADADLLTGNRADVNNDGRVDVTDLVQVARNFGKTIPQTATQNPDVNRDGVVTIADLLLVASLLGDAPAAPALYAETPALHITDLKQWIHLAKNTEIASLQPEETERGIRTLERILSALQLPTETRLLANYPNPFNPETWIPYQLTSPAAVTLHIHATDGTLVRTLALGHRAAGRYHSRNRAAHWDGRNEQGERIGSGVYFYTLTAGEFTATRKLLIRK